MLHFWLGVFSRAILDTLAGIGKDPADIRLSIFIFASVTILLLIRNRKSGWRAWWQNVKQRFWKIVGEDAAIILVIVALIFIYNCLREPYLMWGDEHKEMVQVQRNLESSSSGLTTCAANLQTERVKSELLGNQISAQMAQISGQQTLISGQASTSAKQQSTFDMCVTTLAKANAPIQETTTLLFSPDMPITSKNKHAGMMIILTNKQRMPARVLVSCDGPIDVLTVLPFGGGPPFQGAVLPVSGNLLAGSTKKAWLINVSQPEWTPTQPLLFKLDYDVDDLGQCWVR